MIFPKEEIELFFQQNANIRITLKTPAREVGLLSLCTAKDGSCFLFCPRQFLNVDQYLFGGVVMPPRVTILEDYKLNENNGFVSSKEPVKLTLHPSGYIQASQTTSADIANTSQIEMGPYLGGLMGKTIAHIEWANLPLYENNPKINEKYKKFTFEMDEEPNRLVAFLKTSYDINVLMDGFELSMGGKLLSKDFDFTENAFKNLTLGNFVVLPYSICNKNNIMFGHGDEPGVINKCKNPSTAILFGTRDSKNFKSEENKIIWFLLSFLNPKDVTQHIKNNQEASFSIWGGMKNWEKEHIRKTGEQVLILGKKTITSLITP